MPKYRVETNERRWVRCIYVIVCDDVKDAILCVEEDGIEPRTIESGPDNSDSDEVQFQDVRRFADDGDALATAPSQPKPNDELVADIEARVAIARETNEKREADLRKLPDLPIKPYTVVLLVPPLLVPPEVRAVEANEIETFVACLDAITVAAAINEAQHMAVTERDCDVDLAEYFTVLAVFEGHHDEVTP
jgi:hypothetical protein